MEGKRKRRATVFPESSEEEETEHIPPVPESEQSSSDSDEGGTIENRDTEREIPVGPGGRPKRMIKCPEKLDL